MISRTIWIAILIVTVTFTLSIVFLMVVNFKQRNIHHREIEHQAATDHATNTPANSDEIRLKKIDTSDWKTYRNANYGFELKYPPNWTWELKVGSTFIGFYGENIFKNQFSSDGKNKDPLISIILAEHDDSSEAKEIMDSYIKGAEKKGTITDSFVIMDMYKAYQIETDYFIDNSDVNFGTFFLMFNINNIIYDFSIPNYYKYNDQERKEILDFLYSILSTFKIIT